MANEISSKELKRIVISGGGTGGHIFPALSIAQEINRRYPECEILFFGAEGRMESERIPAAGYPIKLLPVQGLPRGRNPFAKIKSVFNLLRSVNIAQTHLSDFEPQAAIGVGGYASAPTLLAASRMNIPTLVQEQNSFAGVTNKLVGRRAKVICVAYKNMERFFPKAPKIILTGNPIRANLMKVESHSPEAYRFFNLNPQNQTLLILGGSLGAHTINDGVAHELDYISAHPEIQVIWQCGKGYLRDAERMVQDFGRSIPNLILSDFIDRMDYAYSVADLVVSRAGAGSISEFTLLGLPVILVPSPNVAEDHQTKNALALVNDDAAIMIRDVDAAQKLMTTAFDLLHNPDRLAQLGANALKLACPRATADIVDEIERIAN